MPRSCCFEPGIDHLVTKIPQFAFEEFLQTDSTLNPQRNGERARPA
jgi:carbamoylphosphate synthase large subunit